jgi:hypothetical protein
LEWFVYRLRSLALFDLLELTGKLTIVVAIVVWFLEADQRARQAEEAIKARHYRAWELINAARGSTGDGGRRDALQDLTKDRVSLAAAPLEQAHLPDIDLQGAILPGANLQGAWLVGAKLQGAYLVGAKLQGAHLQSANLQGAHLGDANLQDAIIGQAQLDAAKGNDQTVLPYGLTRPAHWAKAEGPEVPPAAQPKDAEKAPATSGAPGSAK